MTRITIPNEIVDISLLDYKTISAKFIRVSLSEHTTRNSLTIGLLKSLKCYCFICMCPSRIRLTLSLLTFFRKLETVQSSKWQRILRQRLPIDNTWPECFSLLGDIGPWAHHLKCIISFFVPGLFILSWIWDGQSANYTLTVPIRCHDCCLHAFLGSPDSHFTAVEMAPLAGEWV